MNEIFECTCPKCGEPVENYYEGSEEIECCDDDTLYIDYNCHCRCGTKFIYTEWFELKYTTVEVV